MIQGVRQAENVSFRNIMIVVFTSQGARFFVMILLDKFLTEKLPRQCGSEIYEQTFLKNTTRILSNLRLDIRLFPIYVLLQLQKFDGELDVVFQVVLSVQLELG